VLDLFDERLPLVERLNKLALMIGSERGLPEHRTEAEALVREAIVCLTSLLRESSGRQSVLDALTSWNNALREENERLKKERDEAILSLSYREESWGEDL